MPAPQGQVASAAALPNLDPVAAIQAILESEKAPAKPAKQAQVPEQAPEQQEQVPEGEAQPEAEEAPPEDNRQVEGEDAPQEDAQAVTEIPLEQLEAITLPVTYKGEDGKDVTEEIPVKALREGYMRQQDYSRKTAEVARQREEVGTQVRQAVESERGQYVNVLQELQSVVLATVAPELKDVNWSHLATNDPLEYVRLDNRRKEITNVLTELKQKQTEATEKQQADSKKAMHEVATKALETLQSEIPGWNPTLYQSVLKAGESLGYKHDEVANWIDPRAIKLLHKAHLYDQLKAGKPLTGNKVAIAPKVMKPGARTISQSQQAQGEAMKRLHDSGRVEDAAAVIRARMG
jgi:hypothetical protein